MTRVAVVLLNYNGEKLLAQFLTSVLEHSQEAQVVVVDNGSTDSSVELLRKSFPQVSLILFSENVGYSGGYNKALAQLDSEIVVLLNSDVEVTNGWLASPMRLLESNSDIAAVQPKILSWRNKNEFEYAGAAGGFIDSMGYPFCRGRIFTTTEKDEGQYNDRVEIFWASGACLFIKRQVYLEAGGLDEDFFTHMEEIDLCWRLNRVGKSIYYDGGSSVYHVGGGTLAQGSPIKVYYNFKNGLTMLVKNLPTPELIYKIPFRLILDWAAALNFLVHGHVSNALAVIKAHIFFLAGIGHDLRKRARSAQFGFAVRRGLILNKWIVIEYFLKKRTLYREIKNPK